MPNHVTNRITIKGTDEQVQKVKEAVKSDECGLGSIDFGKIIPMPKELNIESGTRTDRGLAAYKRFVEIYTAGKQDVDPLHIQSEAEKAYLKSKTDVQPQDWALGRTAFQNVLKYGVPTWYEWCIKNWDTKWNAYGYQEGESCDNGNVLKFMTAWSRPGSVMDKLAAMFPEVDFTHEWADEDIGHNCGRAEYSQGECTELYCPEGDVESVEFAARVMDSDPAGWGLALNAAEDKYIYLGNEKYDLVEIFDQPALFSNGRITPSDYPKGMYCYYFRESESEQFATIEPKVIANLGGSLLMKEPLDFGKDGCISLTEDTAPNFLGEELTIAEFQSYRFEQDNDQEESGGMDFSM